MRLTLDSNQNFLAFLYLLEYFMEAIISFVKDIGKQKVIVLAIFMTTVFINYFMFYTSQNLLKLSDDYKFALVVVMLFTGMLIFIWTLVGLYHLVTSSFKTGVSRIQSSSLDNNEISFILTLAERPNEFLDINTINYNFHGITRLEVIKTAKDLERKGLIHISDFDASLVWLTDEGVQKAFELSKK